MKPAILALFLVWSGSVRGQAPAQDFSKGFGLMVELGLPAPDAAATWAKVTDPNVMEYQLREFTRAIKGNGWLIRGKDGKLRQLPLGGIETVEMPSDSKELPPQDLRKDVESIIESLHKVAAKKNPDEILSEYSYASIDPMLIFAAQLHQAGHKDLANRLAHAAFAFFPSRQLAIDAVVNRIAEQAHGNIAAAFFESGDWAAYHRGLAALVERYPRGWGNREAVRLMLPQLQRQAKGETAADPTLPGVKLHPEAVAALRELMQAPKREAKADPSMQDVPPELEGIPPELRRQVMMGGMMGRGFRGHGGGEGFHQYLWLLHHENPDAKNAESRLAKLGMEALPALAAVVDDPFFTYKRNTGSSDRSYSSNESGEERILRAYQSLNRPATRGEIAVRMLALTLPDPENGIREADAQALREMTMEFWKAHRNDTQMQLAAVFLKEGSQQQVAQAVGVLAQSKDPDAHKMFEEHVLAADPAILMFNGVQTYLKARKAEGKPFYDRYAQLVRKQTADAGGEESDPFGGGYNPQTWQIREAGGVEKILKQLQAIAEGESPRAMAIRIGKEEGIGTARASINGLMEAMNGEEPKNQLIALLSGAYAASKDENVRAQFLMAMFRIPWGSEGGEGDGLEVGDGDAEKKEPADREISEAEAKVWQRLITDTRPLKSGQQRYGGDIFMPTVSALACAALESSVSRSGGYYQLMNAIPAMGRPAEEVVTERARARLDGKSVPPLPDAEKVTPERLAVIVAEAGRKPAGEVHAYLKTLSMDERMAWMEWLEDPGDIPVPDNVKQLRLEIVKQGVHSPYSFDALPSFELVPVGFQITEPSIDKLVQSLAAQPAKYSRHFVYAGSTDFGPGLEVVTFVAPLPEPKKQEDESDEDSYGRVMGADVLFSDEMSYFEEEQESEAVIFAEIDTDEGNAEAMWTVKGGKATRFVQDEGEKKEDEFSQTLKTLREEGDSGSPRLQVRMLSRADADKLNTNHE